MKQVQALILAGGLLVAGISLAIALPQGGIPSLLDLGAERLSPPPEMRIASPADGEGVPARVTLRGAAASEGGTIIDVQVRLDEGRWQSVSDAPRGAATSAFTLDLDLSPGDHLIEARAFDGEVFSAPARIAVRRDAPTVHILSPADGAGVEAGSVFFTGKVRGAASAVVLASGDERAVANVLPDGSWTAILRVANGVRTVNATALAPIPSLPHAITLAAGSPAPPTLTIVNPRDGSAYGEAGDLACGGGCIVFGGTALGASRVAATIDGLPAGNATMGALGAWTFRLPVVALANGTHTATFAPFDASGQPGAPRSLGFAARTSLALRLVGDATARPTGTPLEFESQGERRETTQWSLDGRPVASGERIVFHLATPGHHLLSARTEAPDGRSSSASIPLYAINIPPEIVVVHQPRLVEGEMEFSADARDTDGSIVEFRWQFGDGKDGITRNDTVRHSYATRGVYVVNLTVVDDFGATVTSSLHVPVPNIPPAANFSWSPAEPSILDVVNFTDESFDLDGKIVQRTWTFPGGNTSANKTPSLRLRERGDQPVTLKVLDDANVLSRVTRTIHVRNLAPEARFDHAPAVPRSHEEILFTDASVDLDGPIVSRVWDFGDGTNATGVGVLHAYAAPGTYQVTLRILDDLGANATLTLPVVVADSEPQVSAVLHEPLHPRAIDEVKFRAVATNRDGNILLFEWDFGDGIRSTLESPSHRYSRSGHYHGSLRVTNGAGLSSSFPFHVLVENALPRAKIELGEGGLAAFPTILRANATDPDGRMALYRFDADGDGVIDCESAEPVCAFVYELPGVYAAYLSAEDDEAAIVEAHLLVDIAAPPSRLAPPKITVESPLREARVRGDHLFRGDVSGVRPIATVELQVRNATWSHSGGRESWRLANGNTSWTSLVDTRAFPDGSFDLVVRATDTGGGVGFARIPIVVENGERPSDVSLRLLDTPETVSVDTPIRGSAFHPLGAVTVRWRVDEGSWHLIQANTLAFTLEIDRDLLKPGPHTLRVEAYRGTSESANVTHTFVVPGVAPILVVDEPPAPVAHGLLHAAGRIVGEGRAEWKLDHGVWRSLQPGIQWNLTRDTLDIDGGPHEIHIRAVSPDGRLKSETVTYRVSVVNPPFQTILPRDEPPHVTAQTPFPTPVAILALLGGAAFALRRRS